MFNKKINYPIIYDQDIDILSNKQNDIYQYSITQSVGSDIVFKKPNDIVQLCQTIQNDCNKPFDIITSFSKVYPHIDNCQQSFSYIITNYENFSQSIDKKVEEARSKYGYVKNKLENMGTRLETLETKVGNLETEVNGMKTELRQVNETLQRLVDQLQNNNQQHQFN